MSNPEYVRVGEKLYKINTDFRVALKCEKVAMDNEIKDEERALAIVYLLYGEEGLENPQDYEELLAKAILYLKSEKEDNSNETPDMDFEQDKAYIKASFYTDYNIPDIYEKNMHWYDFVTLLNGLKQDCVLNRVREIRNFDTSQIKDAKTLTQIMKQKEAVALKKEKTETSMTEEQEKSCDEFWKQIETRWLHWTAGWR